MFDADDDSATISGVNDYSFPCAVLRVGENFTMSKIDLNGNVWTFTSTENNATVSVKTSSGTETVEINPSSTDYQCGKFSYSKTNHTLGLIAYSPGAKQDLPTIYHNTGAHIYACVYNSSMGDSVVFPTIGDMITKGSEYMLNETGTGY